MKRIIAYDKNTGERIDWIDNPTEKGAQWFKEDFKMCKIVEVQ